MGVFDVETGQGAARGDRQQLHLLEGRYGDEVPSVFAPWDRTAGAVGAADTSNPPSASSGWAGFPNTVEWFRTLYEWGLAAFHERDSTVASREEQLYKRPPDGMVGTDHRPAATDPAGIPEYLQGFLFGRKDQTFTTDTSTNPDTTEVRHIPRTLREWGGDFIQDLLPDATAVGDQIYEFLFGEAPDTPGGGWTEAVQNSLKAARDTAVNAYTMAGRVFTTLYDDAAAWWNAQGSAIATALGQAGNAFWNWLIGLNSTVRGRITAAATWVASAADNIKNALFGSVQTAAMWLQNNVVTALGAANNAFWNWLIGLNSTVRGRITAAATWVASAADNIKNALFGSVQTAAMWLQNNVVTALGAANNAFWNWLIGLNSTVRGRITAAATWVSNAATNITTALGNTWTAIDAWLDDTYTTANQVWLSIRDHLFGSVNSVARTALQWVETNASNIGTYLTNLSNTIWSWLNDLGDTARGWIHAIGDWLNSVFPTSDGDGQSGDGVRGRAETARTTGNVLSAIWNGISTNVGSVVRGAIDSLASAVGRVPIVGETLAAVITGIADLLPKFESYSTSNRGPGRETSGGDINVNTHDIINVDRLFFESNDPLVFTDARPHITGNTVSTSRSMQFFVPKAGTYTFYTRIRNAENTADDTKELMNMHGTLGMTLNEDLLVQGNIDTTGKLRGDYLELAERYGDAPLPRTRGRAYLYIRNTSGGRRGLYVAYFPTTGSARRSQILDLGVA